jgi:phosphatidylethanolamine/phosphatidyl-N-methylethanolamine N-methyltransferase
MINFFRQFFITTLILAVTLSSHATALTWVKGFIKNPKKVGALAPCSKYCADELARYLHHTDNRPLRILEVGAGTGAITKTIINKMNSRDHLDCIELDSEYCNQLQKEFGHHDNVAIHCMSITDFNPVQKYDVIISTLPFNSLPPQLVQQVVNQYNKIIKSNGYISYIEYIVLGNVKRLILSYNECKEWDAKQKTLEDWRSKYGIGRPIIWRNFPPSYVYHLQISG